MSFALVGFMTYAIIWRFTDADLSNALSNSPNFDDITTNSLEVKEILVVGDTKSNLSYTFPSSRGNAGQILQDQGGGGQIEWVDFPLIGPDPIFNTVTVGGSLGYIFPSDLPAGAGQILTSAGVSGELKWQNSPTQGNNQDLNTFDSPSFYGLTLGQPGQTVQYDQATLRPNVNEILHCSDGGGNLSWINPSILFGQNLTNTSTPFFADITITNSADISSLTVGSGTQYTFPSTAPAHEFDILRPVSSVNLTNLKWETVDLTNIPTQNVNPNGSPTFEGITITDSGPVTYVYSFPMETPIENDVLIYKSGNLVWDPAPGSVVSSFQDVYDASSPPFIETSIGEGGIVFQNGTGDESDDVITINNGTPVKTFGVTGSGEATMTRSNISTFTEMTEITTPALSSSGTLRLYFKSDGELYKIDDTGSEEQISGGASGDMQDTYDNSGTDQPKILTDSAANPVSIQRGGAGDNDVVLSVLNGGGTTTFSVNGNGAFTSTNGLIAGPLLGNPALVIQNTDQTATGTFCSVDFTEQTSTLIGRMSISSGDMILSSRVSGQKVILDVGDGSIQLILDDTANAVTAKAATSTDLGTTAIRWNDLFLQGDANIAKTQPQMVLQDTSNLIASAVCSVEFQDSAGSQAAEFSFNSGNVTISNSGAGNIIVDSAADSGHFVPGSVSLMDLGASSARFRNIYHGGFTDGSHIATPVNPTAGNNRLYFKNDSELYMLTSSGTESQVSGATTQNLNDVYSASSPPLIITSLAEGGIFIRNGTGDNDDNVLVIQSDAPATTFSVTGNGDLTATRGNIDTFVQMTEIVTPGSASSGTSRLYFKNDNELYKIDDAGSEVQISGVAGGDLQGAYDNSGTDQPKILTDNPTNPITFRNGSSGDTETVIAVQNISGTSTFMVNGNGDVECHDTTISATAASQPTLTIKSNDATTTAATGFVDFKDQADTLIGRLNLTGGSMVLQATIAGESVTLTAGASSVIIDDTGNRFHATSGTDLGSTGSRWNNLFLDGDADVAKTQPQVTLRDTSNLIASAASSLELQDSASAKTAEFAYNSGSLTILNAGANDIIVDSVGDTGHFRPRSTDLMDLGTASNRFCNIYGSGFIDDTQISTPSNPTAGSNRLYFKSDNELYTLDSAGNELSLSDSSISTLQASYDVSTAPQISTTASNLLFKVQNHSNTNNLIFQVANDVGSTVLDVTQDFGAIVTNSGAGATDNCFAVNTGTSLYRIEGDGQSYNSNDIHVEVGSGGTPSMFLKSTNQAAALMSASIVIEDSGSVQVAALSVASEDLTITVDNGDLIIDTSGHVVPVTTSTIDLGSTSLQFKDLYVSGRVIVSGGSGNLDFISGALVLTAVGAGNDVSLVTDSFGVTLDDTLSMFKPTANAVLDLGSAASQYKDLYLATKIDFGNTAATINLSAGDLHVSCFNDKDIIFATNNNNFYLDDAGDSIRPGTTGTLDLGLSTFQYKDLYLSNKIDFSGSAVTIAMSGGDIVMTNNVPSNDIIFVTDAQSVCLDDTAGTLRSGTNNFLDLGSTTFQYKDLYLSSKIDFLDTAATINLSSGDLHISCFDDNDIVLVTNNHSVYLDDAGDAFRPGSDDTIDLGIPGFQFQNIYAGTAMYVSTGVGKFSVVSGAVHLTNNNSGAGANVSLITDSHSLILDEQGDTVRSNSDISLDVGSDTNRMRTGYFQTMKTGLVKDTFTAFGGISAGRVLLMRSNGRVNTISTSDAAETPVIGVSIDSSASAGDLIEVAVSGRFDVVLADGTVIVAGDGIKRNDSGFAGRVMKAEVGDAGLFAVAETGGTGTNGQVFITAVFTQSWPTGGGSSSVKPQIKLTKNSLQAIPVSTHTKLSWNITPEFNDDITLSSNNFVIATTGRYLIGYEISFTDDDDGYRQSYMTINRSTGEPNLDLTIKRHGHNARPIDDISGVFTAMCGSEYVNLNATDTVQVWVNQTSPGALSVPRSTEDAWQATFWAIYQSDVPGLPQIKLSKNTVQSIANTTFVKITWEATVFNTDATELFDNININTTGKYLVGYEISFTTAVSGIRESCFTINSSATAPQTDLTIKRHAHQARPTDDISGAISFMTASEYVDLTSGDTLQVWVNQTSGGALNVPIANNDAYQSTFWAIYQGV